MIFVTWDGGGNLPPLLGVALAAAARGDDVRVLGHAVQRRTIEAAGLPFTPITAGRDYVSSEPRGTVGALLGLSAVFADRGIGADARALLAAEPADLVVVDCLLWGAIDELADTGTPVVSLVHSLASFFDGNARGPLRMLARLRGTDPVRALGRVSRTVVTTRADFEPPTYDTSSLHYTGFVWQGMPVEAVAATPPRVLVSFSTTVFPGQARALQRVLDALAGLELDVTVTSGAVAPEQLRPPANAQVVRRQDHAELLPATSLVIGHGGHATTARALSAGIPVLVIPMHPLMDQPAVGRSVARLGVGATLPKSASSARIRDAALALLADHRVHEAAARLGAEARARNGALAALDALDALVPAK